MGKVKHLKNRELRQAIKRDELKEFLEESLEWIKGHLENVIIGVVAVAVIGFGTTYFYIIEVCLNEHENRSKLLAD